MEPAVVTEAPCLFPGLCVSSSRGLRKVRQLAGGPCRRRENKTGTKIKWIVYKRFLIKIVIHFRGRRGPLRTIVLPKWQAPSLAALPRAKEGREVTGRGMGGGTSPSREKKAKWEVGGGAGRRGLGRNLPGLCCRGAKHVGDPKAGILSFLLFCKVMPPSLCLSYPRRAPTTSFDREDRATTHTALALGQPG